MKNKNDSRGSKVVKLSSQYQKTFNLKMIFLLVTIMLILAALIIRIGWLQFVEGGFLKEQAYSQQTINQIISPKRGNIYDSTGKTLATSAQVDTVTINPQKIQSKSPEETTSLKEEVAHGLSEIFELNYEETLNKVNSTSSVETIARKVEQDKITKLKEWMKSSKINIGINIDEDSKRYYPYNNVASGLIGFCRK